MQKVNEILDRNSTLMENIQNWKDENLARPIKESLNLTDDDDIQEGYDDKDKEPSALQGIVSLITWIGFFFAAWVLWNCEKIHFKQFLWVFLIFGGIFSEFAIWIPIFATLYAYFVQKCAKDL